MRTAIVGLALLALGCSSSSLDRQNGAGGNSAICELPRETGPCQGAFPRWWFNAERGQCEVFSYGGCEGNANNFETIVQCAGTCAPGAEPCSVVDCGHISVCVYLSGEPTCAVMCGEGCAEPCVCGSSCPTCKDCLEVCPPQ